MGKIISICKDGVRYDIDLNKAIAVSTPSISEGTIVTKDGHKGKVLRVKGSVASVSWEDASMSEVPVGDLTYDSTVEKGGAGSGRYPKGSGKDKGKVQAENLVNHIMENIPSADLTESKVVSYALENGLSRVEGQKAWAEIHRGMKEVGRDTSEAKQREAYRSTLDDKGKREFDNSMKMAEYANKEGDKEAAKEHIDIALHSHQGSEQRASETLTPSQKKDYAGMRAKGLSHEDAMVSAKFKPGDRQPGTKSGSTHLGKPMKDYKPADDRYERR